MTIARPAARRLAPTVAATLALLVAAPAAATAAPAPADGGTTAKAAAKKASPSRSTLRKAVKKVAFERVYGSNYRIMKARYPQTSPLSKSIIWDNDGCSVPKAIIEANSRLLPLGKAVGFYSDLFEKSCDRHDFGYRNYGSAAGGLALKPRPSMRDDIDDRFHKNMDYQCKRVFKGGGLAGAAKRVACYKASDTFHYAVSHFAEDRFFS